MKLTKTLSITYVTAQQCGDVRYNDKTLYGFYMPQEKNSAGQDRVPS